MGIVDDYVDSVYEERKFFAVYPPNESFELGTYGELRGHRFIRRGTLRDLPSPILLDTSPTDLERVGYRSEFKVRNARAIKVGAGVNVDVSGIVTARAALKIEFNSGFGAYVGLAGMRVVGPKDLTTVEAELVRRAELPTTDPEYWNPEYRVVTHLLWASKATVLMSKTSGSKVVLQAKGDVPRIDFADAEIGFDTLFDDTSEDQFVPEGPSPEGITPFFWLMRVDFGFLGLGSGKAKFEISRSPAEPQARLALQPEGHPFDLSMLER
jgi:hypothetical protein